MQYVEKILNHKVSLLDNYPKGNNNCFAIESPQNITEFKEEEEKGKLHPYIFS